MINLNEPYDVYVATEVGNVSNGGVSKWVDDWITNVASHLIVKPILIIEIEQDDGWIEYAKQFVDVIHRPGSLWEWEYTISQLPITNYFSLPDRRTVDMIIKGARKFHLLSYPLPIMMYGNSKDWSIERMREVYKRKIDSVCIHSLESETLKYQQKLRKFTKKSLGYQQKSIDFQNTLIKDGEVSIWIGLDNENQFDFMIPNVYEFKHNLSAVDSNVVGFPARCEPRKNIHFLQKIDSVALTSEETFDGIFDDYKKKVKFSNIKIDDYLFDVTEYANNHPGGYNILKKLNNKDATEEFNSIKGQSDSYVYGLLDKFCIGKDTRNNS